MKRNSTNRKHGDIAKTATSSNSTSIAITELDRSPGSSPRRQQKQQQQNLSSQQTETTINDANLLTTSISKCNVYWHFKNLKI